jgi:tRNA A37 threonylcarbamoyltransferase TsaD
MTAPSPTFCLLVSGGHCQFLEVRGLGDYGRLGSTIDDAAGEAFDKTAKLLGLGFPGGPAVERIGANGNPKQSISPAASEQARARHELCWPEDGCRPRCGG